MDSVKLSMYKPFKAASPYKVESKLGTCFENMDSHCRNSSLAQVKANWTVLLPEVIGWSLVNGSV